MQGRDQARLGPTAAFLAGQLRSDDGPQVVECARFIDRLGWETQVFVAYWLRRGDFDRWFARLQGWWDEPGREVGEVSLWREVLDVPSQRIENIFSSPIF